ncbi:EF-1 guanine nucleotide exchange domain-containing protein [Fusarium oxysporum f. sp. phaseoli]
MGFTDLVSDAGLTVLNSWLSTRSYIVGQSASQADVATFKALSSAPDAEKYPHAARWYKHIASYESQFATLPSVVTLDVKPWDDETDMVALEAAVRAIEKDGLVWGASKLVPVGFGVKKLQINMVVEDEKISVADLEEEIQELEDYVQSTDVAAMQKL